MQLTMKEESSSSGQQPFATRFKDEIKLANLFRSASTINELLNGLKQELRAYFDAEALTIYFADNKKKQIVSKVRLVGFLPVQMEISRLAIKAQ